MFARISDFFFEKFIGPFALEVMKSIKDDTAHTAAMLLSGIITRRPHFLVKKDMIKMLIDGFSDTFVSDIWFHSRLGQGSAEGLSDESDTPIQLEVQDQTMVCIDLMAQQVPTKSLINVALAKFHEVCYIFLLSHVFVNALSYF